MKFNVETYNGEQELPNVQIGDFVLAVEDRDCPNLSEHMEKTGIERPDLGDTIKPEDVHRVQMAMTAWIMQYGIAGELVGRTDDSLHIKTADHKVHAVALEDVMAVIQQKKEAN